MRKRQSRKSFKRTLSIIFLIIAVLALIYGICIYYYDQYTIKNVIVEGNVHYTSDEIKKMVLGEEPIENSLYLSYKFRNKKEITDVPFVDAISVRVVEKNTVRIIVYEKTLAGFVEYLGRYVYFDKDGIVVENSPVKTEGIPEVVGVDLDYIVLYEPLPVEDKELFKKVLNITKLLNKYEVKIESIYFSDMDEITLYKDNISIALGKDENLDVKIMNLPSILANLSDESGILRMEKYDENTKRVTFEKAN